MDNRVKEAIDLLDRQVKDLEAFLVHVESLVNAIRAKEEFQKWKKQTLVQVAEKIGDTYAKTLSITWVETAFAGGDMYDELSDDIEMCLRHLKKLRNEIRLQGLDEPSPSESSVP
ncbi:MAG: hypothetical protein VST68_13000 [Nitrospirota bacterium]|nr:hypothetical protein [Nitrospirota bacterium]